MSNYLLSPKTKREQLIGVYEFVSGKKIDDGPFSKGFMRHTDFYDLIVKDLVIDMFIDGDVGGYRYSVIRQFLIECECGHVDLESAPYEAN